MKGKKMSKMTKKQMKKARRAEREAAALVIETPVVAALPTKRANGKGVAKERLARLNPDVTERMKVRLTREGKTVQNLTDRLEAARKRRNDTIRTLCDRGVSEREIGEMVGMSGPRINQIYHGTNGSRS